MIIYGTRVRSSRQGEGDFQCPNCKTQQRYRKFAMRRWFTLYFIPVIPLDSLGGQVECQGCFSRFERRVLSQRDQFESEKSGFPQSMPNIKVQNRNRDPQTTSGLAIASIVFALISPFLVCVFGLSLVTSIVAIITGHWSLSRIKHSAGRLAGDGMATKGLVIGYVVLGLSLVWHALLFSAGNNAIPGGVERFEAGLERAGPATATSRLSAAERSVVSANRFGGSVAGNSRDAIALARSFSRSMKQMREQFFTGDGDKGLLSEGQFVTHCELRESGCAFIVHVPGYRDFEPKAKDRLSEIAWLVANETTSSTLEAGESLAVGMRGVLLYGDILVGRASGSLDPNQEFEKRERGDLLAFFEGASRQTVIHEQATQPQAIRETIAAKDQKTNLETDQEPGPEALAERPPSNSSSAETKPLQQNQEFAPGIVSPGMPPPVGLPIAANPGQPNPFDPSLSGAFPPPGINVPPPPRGMLDAPGFPMNPQPSAESLAQPSPGTIPTPERSPVPVPSLVKTPSIGTPSRDKGDEPPIASRDDVIRIFPMFNWGVSSVAFASNGRWVATAGTDRIIQIQDIETGKILSANKSEKDYALILHIAFSPDDRHLVSARHNGSMKLLPIDENGLLGESKAIVGQGAKVECLAFSRSSPFVVSGAQNGEMLWQSFSGNASRSRQQKMFDRGLLAVHLPRKGLEAMATDGKSFARINLRSAEISDREEFRRSPVRLAKFSNDGKKLAICSGREIEILDTSTRKSIMTLKSERETQWSLVFLPDGERIISGGRTQATLWNIETSEVLHHFKLEGSGYVKSLAVSNDGNRLAVIPSGARQSLHIMRIPERAE